MQIIDPVEYKQLVLGVLIKIDELCRENNIEYCLFYGSLLGAKRHGGFIPWDDDIDLVMRRDQYDKLREVIIHNPDCGLNFIDITTNKKTIYAFAKICDARTKVIDKYFIDVDGYGAFVDIFPFDYLPENAKIRERKMKYCKFLNRLRAVGSRKKPDKSLHGVKKIKGIIAYLLTKIINSHSIVAKIDSIGRECNEIKTNYFGFIQDPKEVFPVEWLFPNKSIQFEGHSFPGPNKVHECLEYEYGDYMKLPPEDHRVPHHIECWYCAEDN